MNPFFIPLHQLYVKFHSKIDLASPPVYIQMSICLFVQVTKFLCVRTMWFFAKSKSEIGNFEFETITFLGHIHVSIAGCVVPKCTTNHFDMWPLNTERYLATTF